MPFVIRKIKPKYIGRGHVPQDTTSAEIWPVGAELGAITNGALANTLKQLSSLLANAEDIFEGLNAELTDITNRSSILKEKITRLDDQLSQIDPKKIPVPESDISTFASKKVHHKATQKLSTGLFVAVTRPVALRKLYEAAAVIAVRNLDSLQRDRDESALDMYLCTPVLGRKKKDQTLEIESRVPAMFDDLRRWTSTEALGDITVAPDCTSRILQKQDDGDDAVDHKLPSPEERVQAIALKFPGEVVPVDVSGRSFIRMSMRRKSLHGNQLNDNEVSTTGVKRRSTRLRKTRGKRRNTIAGTDGQEIRKAVKDDNDDDINCNNKKDDKLEKINLPYRSASSDILGEKKDVPTELIKWNFDVLKSWGGKLRLKRSVSNNKTDVECNNSNDKSVLSSSSSSSSSNTTASKVIINDDTRVYDHSIVKTEQNHKKERSHERKASLSSLSGRSVASSIALSVHTSDKQYGVRLRESAAQRRERRKRNNNRDDQLHSSSGNWSASSESGRTSIGSETTTTTNPPRSISTTSNGACSSKLSQNYAKRFRGRDTSTSSSVTSEGTLTPDIIQDIGGIPFSDEIEAEGETCSVYSCDTEGYYTSFHMDSGLKTLREEEITVINQHNYPTIIKSNVSTPIVENEYELFGRGSTSTTTSSAGTVCTTLMAPVPPERKSSLTVVALVHGQNKNGGESPDSGHNTSSSPVESASSPACYTVRSCSELEYSESSDLEGCDRIERIRSKTAISTSRIPSMCVITPTGSDDEQQQQQQQQQYQSNNNNTNDPQSPKYSVPIKNYNDKKPNTFDTGSVVMSATVGSSKMEVINGDDKNLYATVQKVQKVDQKPKVTVDNNKTTTLTSVLERIRCALPITSRKYNDKLSTNAQMLNCHDSGDYVTIADVRNNNDKYHLNDESNITYENTNNLINNQQKESEYVSLNDLPKKADSSLERKRQGARVTLDSQGKVIYSSDSLKRRKGAHTTFNPGPFVKNVASSSVDSPSFNRRTQVHVRPIPTTVTTTTKTEHQDQNVGQDVDVTDFGKLVIRAKNSDRGGEVRGAYVNIQNEEDNGVLTTDSGLKHQQEIPKFSSPPPYKSPPKLLESHHKLPQQRHFYIANNKQAEYFKEERDRKKCEDDGVRGKDLFITHQYHTMPNRKLEKDNDLISSNRSITPDITKELGSIKNRNNLNENYYQISSNNSQNRYFAPLNLNALGYRFFASSPINSQKENYNSELEALNNSIISPIKGLNNKNITSKSMERLNASSPSPTLSAAATNKLLPPGKSTMTNDELFAAIYKSKRKLNIKNDHDVKTDNKLNLHLEKPGSRHSWSPESQNVIPQITSPISANVNSARLDFKRLLLQKSPKIGLNKLSAAEQLKLSRRQLNEQQQQQPQILRSPISSQQSLSSLTKALSPRSIWRFQTPRSDVLSSTIIEDTAAEEKAMKPSPTESSTTSIPITQSTDTKSTNSFKNNVKRQLYPPETRKLPSNSMPSDSNVPSFYSNLESESRRIRNRQLKADFFADISTTDRYKHRARSESPSQLSISSNTQNKTVTRCPSAPTLETAL